MQCPICHTPLHGENFCPECGQSITYEGIPEAYLEKHTCEPTTTYVPAEVKKFNWAAFTFSLNFAWAIGNKTYLPFLCLIPYFNLIWIFVCGFKGNEWAWKKNNYQPKDLERFLAIQHTWNRAGIAQFILSIISIIFAVLINLFLLSLMPGIFY